MPDKIKTAKDLIAEEYGFKVTPEVVVKPSSMAIYKGSQGLDRYNFLKNKFGNGLRREQPDLQKNKRGNPGT